MIPLIALYVVGLLFCALGGGIVYYTAYSDHDPKERKMGARLFMQSPLWPLLLIGFLRDTVVRMRKDLDQ